MTEEQLKEVNKALNSIGLENVQNIIVIRYGATNGDMIKAMFPDADIIEFIGTITVDIPKHGAKCRQKIRFSLDWWNALYEKGEQK